MVRYLNSTDLKAGHKLFQLNCKTRELISIPFKRVIGKTGAKIEFEVSDYCIYTTALNEENAVKHFKKQLEKLPKKVDDYDLLSV